MIVTRSRECSRTTPFVDIVTVKVNRLVSGVAVEIVSDLSTDIRSISSSVSDTLVVALGLDVRLGVTDSSLNEGAGFSVGVVVGDFVSGEETDHVGVVGESVNNSGVALVEGNLPGRISAVDRVSRGTKIDNHVDVGVSECVDTAGVVVGRVNTVNTNGVCIDGSQVGDITLARGQVGERVDKAVGAGGRLLVGDTFDEELSTIGLVEELASLDDDLIDTAKSSAGEKSAGGGQG